MCGFVRVCVCVCVCACVCVCVCVCVRARVLRQAARSLHALCSNWQQAQKEKDFIREEEEEEEDQKEEDFTGEEVEEEFMAKGQTATEQTRKACKACSAAKPKPKRRRQSPAILLDSLRWTCVGVCGRVWTCVGVSKHAKCKRDLRVARGGRSVQVQCVKWAWALGPPCTSCSVCAVARGSVRVLWLKSCYVP